MDNLDSGDIPSLGYSRIRALNPAEQERAKESKRRLISWLSETIRQAVETSPKVKELEHVCQRQDSTIDTLSQNVRLLLSRVHTLDDELKHLKAKTHDYKKWEGKIAQHISSVDLKSADINTLRSLIYALWDVTIQTAEPEVEKADFLVRSYNHLLSLGPKKRSDTDESGGKEEQRWSRREAE